MAGVGRLDLTEHVRGWSEKGYTLCAVIVQRLLIKVYVL